MSTSGHIHTLKNMLSNPYNVLTDLMDGRLKRYWEVSHGSATSMIEKLIRDGQVEKVKCSDGHIRIRITLRGMWELWKAFKKYPGDSFIKKV